MKWYPYKYTQYCHQTVSFQRNFIYQNLELPDIGKITIRPYGAIKGSGYRGQWYYLESSKGSCQIQLVYPQQDQLLALQIDIQGLLYC